MKTGKDIILNYCETVKTSIIDHLQDCMDNKRDIENGDISLLAGCPMNFGLDDLEGLCEKEEVHGWEAQSVQCLTCWKKALALEIEIKE